MHSTWSFIQCRDRLNDYLKMVEQPMQTTTQYIGIPPCPHCGEKLLTRHTFNDDTYSVVCQFKFCESDECHTDSTGPDLDAAVYDMDLRYEHECRRSPDLTALARFHDNRREAAKQTATV